MRGLLRAALLAPVLVSALVVPNSEVIKSWDDREDNSVSSYVLVPLAWSPDSVTTRLRLEILHSESACGLGNITINGQALQQKLDGDVSTGRGFISMDQKDILVASWTFHCIKVNGQPDAQLLTFVADFINGEVTTDVGFKLLFRQTGATEILNFETNLSVQHHIVANPLDKTVNYPLSDVEDDLAELDWMRAQLQELEWLINQKEQAISRHAHQHFKEHIKDCDSLACVGRVVREQARNVANKVCKKIHGVEDEHESFGHFAKPHFTKPHWLRNPFHGPKQGNHTHPHPPPHKKPHFPLPICRYPPPHHGHHGRPPYGKPPGEHRPDRHHGEMPPLPPHHGEHAPENMAPPPNLNEEQGPIGFSREYEIEDKPHRIQSAKANNNFYSSHRKPLASQHGLGKAFHIIKLTAIGFLLAILLATLHRRTCGSSKKCTARAARKEERHRRRAFHRAAHKQAISRFLVRLGDRQSTEASSNKYEEKHEALLSDVEEGLSTTMTEDFTEFRNAVDIFGDMASVEEDCSRLITISDSDERRSLMRDFDEGSQVGEGEELPAYEHAESEMSSVADGFRYTPGSSDYTPSGDSESVSDTLEPDVKQ